MITSNETTKLIFSVSDLVNATPLARSTIYKLMQKGVIPRPVGIVGTRRVGWPATTFEKLVNGLTAGVEK